MIFRDENFTKTEKFYLKAEKTRKPVWKMNLAEFHFTDIIPVRSARSVLKSQIGRPEFSRSDANLHSSRFR